MTMASLGWSLGHMITSARSCPRPRVGTPPKNGPWHGDNGIAARLRALYGRQNAIQMVSDGGHPPPDSSIMAIRRPSRCCWYLTFRSQVIMIAKPASSAIRINSPFRNLPQSSSSAWVISCCRNARRSPRGAFWSSKMRMGTPVRDGSADGSHGAVHTR